MRPTRIEPATFGLKGRRPPHGRRDCGGDATECDRQLAGLPTIEHMAIKKMEHVGIVVNDLAVAIEFFVELGLEPRGQSQVEGPWVERIIALDQVKVECAMLRIPDGEGEIELVKFHSPPTQTGDPHEPANTPGLRHLAFLVEDIHIPSSTICEPAAPRSSASWCATRTATGSATSAGPRGSSSSWQRRSADGSRP
jgi:catechol 2,3-dioxygenase-like lactoylglutathione lyase family enzyme